MSLHQALTIEILHYKGGLEMQSIIVDKHYKEAKDIELTVINKVQTAIDLDKDCLIKVYSVGINPSDALSTLGYFSHAKLPRVPGRDFSGVVMQGPEYLIGKSVWGTGGAAGIDFDGSLSEYIILPHTAISEIPSTLNLQIAGAQLLPYITAYASLVKRARICKGETVYIVGALGQVGQAAMSICYWKNCKAIALVRGNESVLLAEEKGWIAYDTSTSDFIEKILEKHGKSDVILNSIGNLIWDKYIHSLNDYGRIINIGAQVGTREAEINLFNLYRANQEIIGVNTVAFNYEYNARLLDELKIGFEAGVLQPLNISPTSIFPLIDTNKAFQKVLNNIESTRIIVEVNHE